MASAISSLSLLSNVKCGYMFRLKSAVIKSIPHINKSDVGKLKVLHIKCVWKQKNIRDLLDNDQFACNV